MPVLPLKQHIVARRDGRRTRFFYGSTLRDALDASGVKSGEKFACAAYERGPVMRGVIQPDGKVRKVKFDRQHGF